MRSRYSPPTTLAACLLALTLFLGLASASLAQEAPPPAEVGVIAMTEQPVSRRSTVPGRAVASQQAEIRPRVGGVVTEILYAPGQPVTVGTPMFRLDAASYEAAVSSAEAGVARADAALTQAQTSLRRSEQLEGSGVTSADVDSARATAAEAEADLQSARAALRVAQIELSWTEITSPINGFPDVAKVSVGDLVTAGQADTLTTVTRLDPIYVDMIEPSARLLSIRDEIDSGALRMNETLKVSLTLENGRSFNGTGSLVSPGVQVSTTTGTVAVRFQFDNPNRIILPGMFVRGDVELGTVQAFLVPQRAATRERDGSLTVWVAGEGNLAEQRRIETSGSFENAWVVTEGLAEGDQVIVDGLSSLRAGAEVVPVPVTLDAQGVVQDVPAEAAAD
ncbi:efflux RND transporter periplasmic adaptor subunit [Cereibacter changlensis]|uniref:Efflux RND transporter periplasmic adaptor subunit n=1 Tax=Cereibacter changlensis TaxID=402884 RepID=A0A4V5NLR9_9RHOB|nr:efflux RND transporter periplasmic adaptor subunit [Cereibacter changlensis]TKA96757.1 efflux RND transporter periplasmic adaptor subunit [Cereibacter changlensis]